VRTFLGLLLFIFIVLPLGAASLAMVSLSSWILDRDFYTTVLDDPALYEAILTEEIPASLRQVEVEGIGQVPETALTAGLREVVTPEYLRTQARQVVDEMFEIIDGTGSTIEVTLDLLPVKAELRGEGGNRFALAFAENLPVCAAGEEPRANAGDLPRCRPDNVSPEAIAEQITASLPRLLEATPDQIVLNEPDRVTVNEFPFAGRLSVRTLFENGITIMTIVAALFWFLTAIIGGAGQRSILIWLGWMLAIPALLILLAGAGIVSEPVMDILRRGSAAWVVNGQQVSSEFQTASLGIAREVAGRVGNGFLVVGGVSVGVSLVLLLLGSLSPGRIETGRTVTVPSA
jgi:hypothetical protein